MPSDLAHVDVLATALGVTPRRLLQRPSPARGAEIRIRDTRNTPSVMTREAPGNAAAPANHSDPMS